MPSNFNEAEALKVKGNEKYRVGAFSQAIGFYNAAVALQPEEPVYLSNLSAAQLEDGRYLQALNSCGAALSLINTDDPTRAPLRSKVLHRRSKLLTFLHAQDPVHFADACAACDAVLVDDPKSYIALAQKASLERRRLAHKIEAKVNQRLTDAPRYRCSLMNDFEYDPVGHDIANSIFRVQYTKCDNSSTKHPYAERFNMQVPRNGSPFEFSAMFCGIGDARHIYASLVDIGQDLAEREITYKEKASQNIRIHFAMSDTHPSTLARDLIILTLLHELSTIPTARHKNNPRALDLLLALHYAYWGTTMPPRAHEILEKVLDEVSDSVMKATDQEVALDFNWLYIEPNTVKEIGKKLRWWQGKGKTALSFDAMLPSRLESDACTPSDFPGHPHSQDHGESKFLGSNPKDFMVKSMREDPEVRTLLEPEAKQLGVTLEQYIEVAESMPSEIFSHCYNTPPSAALEKEVWDHLQVMVPPPHANEPKPLDQVFRTIRRGDSPDGAYLSTATDILERAFEHIRKRWRVNFTLLDKDWLKLEYGRPDFQHCPFRGALALFPEHYRSNLCPTTQRGSLYEWSARFFSLAAEGMTLLRACGTNTLKLEIILGDGYAILDKIRLRTITRDSTFPTRFDRIHASSVPDYIGGYLASFTTAVPLLKPLPTSYFTHRSFLNSGMWEGGFVIGNHAMNLDSALYTYAGVTRNEASAAYGVSINCTPKIATDYHTFGRLDTLPKRLDREQLAVVAYGCFIKTVLPAKYTRQKYPGTIRGVLNVHAFFRLIEILKDLGYAPHFLAEIIESILENRVEHSPLPHDVLPIPLASRANMGALCTTPFQAEFEVAAAMWEPRLFPNCSRLIPATHDLVRYSVQFTMARLPYEEPIPKTHRVLVLVFGLPGDLDADITNLGKRLAGTNESHTSIQLMSTFDFDHHSRVATFLLSRKRVESFIQSGFDVAVLNTMFWRIQSKKIPCARMEVVGDLDEWDQKRKIVMPQGRPLTRREMNEWELDILSSCPGPASGHPLMNMFREMSGMQKLDDAHPELGK